MHKHIPDQSVLYLDDVTVSFDGFVVLDGLSLVIEPDQLRCLIGPNGAGKTTLMDVITGRTRPARGRVVFLDEIDLTHLSEAEIADLGVARKFQTPSVLQELSVRENIDVALRRPRGVFANISRRISNEESRRIESILETINLHGFAERRAGELSHGQKQWLEIGLVLAQEPKLLLIDEPVAGMTSEECDRTAELLIDLAREHAVVVVDHDMDFVRSLDSKTTVLHQGQVIAEGTLEHCRESELVNQVYLGG